MRQAKLGEGGSACDDMTETFGCDPTGERPDRPRLANQPEPSVAWSGGDPGCEAYTGSLAGRVIEPRNRPPCGSRRCDKSGRHHRGAEAGRALAVPPGSESGACGQGSPRNLGGLVVSTGEAARAAAINDSPGPLARPERAGANRADGGTAKRRKTKRGGTGGEKSESADSTAEVGEPAPRGPGGGKRRTGSWTVGRTDGLATEPAAVSTQARQLAESRPKRRLAGARQRSDAMVRGAGCANRARPDLREPGEGNHPRPPGPSLFLQSPQYGRGAPFGAIAPPTTVAVTVVGKKRQVSRCAPSSHAIRPAATKAPTNCAAINAGASAGAMPLNVSVNDRAMVTAGLAKDVDAVNQ